MNAERFNSVNKEYKKRYERILKYIWPTIGSNGFAEANQTVNFISAYESIAAAKEENVIFWYEFQIENGNKNNNRIDGLIINHTDKSVYLVESKRFSQSDIDDKRGELGEDLKRILNLNLENRFQSVFIDGESIHNYSVYGVLLFDLWEYKERHKKEKVALELWERFCIDRDINILYEFLYLDQNEENGIGQASTSYLSTMHNVKSYEKSTYHLGIFCYKIK